MHMRNYVFDDMAATLNWPEKVSASPGRDMFTQKDGVVLPAGGTRAPELCAECLDGDSGALSALYGRDIAMD